MSKVFTSALVAGFTSVLIASTSMSVQAQGIERAYGFNNKKPTQKKKTSSDRRFNLFGIFSNSKPKEKPVKLSKKFKTKPKVRIRTYTYRATPLVRLGDNSLTQPVVEATLSGQVNILDDSLAQTIFNVLKASDLSTRMTKRQQQAIVKFYKSRNFKSVWTDMDGVLGSGKQLLAHLSKADEEGMTSADYLPSGLSGFGDGLEKVESDLDLLARFDINLTAMALRYGQNASGGKIIPNRLSSYHDLAPPKVDSSKILNGIAQADKPDNYLASLQPTHKSYAAFKRALAALNDQTEEKQYAQIPSGDLIKAGGSDKRIPLIRERLQSVGLLAKSQEGTDLQQNQHNVYDEQLRDAVKAFQKSKGLSSDGVIGRQTIAAFNGRKDVNKRNKLVMNMERLRWLPRSFGNKYIFVNAAAFKMQVMRNGAEAWQTRVVVGKPQNQTSFFIDEMETVVFNPFWGVPRSIVRSEMLPRLRSNPGYLDQKGFEVFNRSGKKISSSSVDWSSYGSRIPFSVRQPPGDTNALGKVKFMFPNKHAIYLHDTPSKKLFERSSRAFSFGCVRVKNPRVFAQNILGWSRSKIDQKIASRRNSAVRLKQKIPVYITYFTAWADESGNVKYFRDVYGRDRLLDRALNSIKVASK